MSHRTFRHFGRVALAPAAFFAVLGVHCSGEAPRGEASATESAALRAIACYDQLYPVECCFAPDGSQGQPAAGANCSGPIDPQPAYALTYQVDDAGGGVHVCTLHDDLIAVLPAVGECADDGGPLIRWVDTGGERCCQQVAAHYCGGAQPGAFYPVHALTCGGAKVDIALDGDCDAQKDTAAVGTLFVGPGHICN